VEISIFMKTFFLIFLGNISMEIGEDTPKPVKPEISVKVEPIPMEVEPSEKPSGEEPVVDPSGTSDEPMKEEVKTEPLEDIVEEESMEVTPKPEPPELSGKRSYSYLIFFVQSQWGKGQ
jgi:hypothetical protein